MKLELRKRRFTADEYQRMGETGIFGPEDRVELIDGEIVEMTPIGRDHATCVRRLINLLARAFAGKAILDAQNPLRLGDLSEPQPDIVVLRPRADFYAERHPVPADTFLIVEVSDTTLPFDRRVKLPLYAAAGVPEVWIVDLGGEAVEMHRKPGKSGYAESSRRRRGRKLTIGLLPGWECRVEDVIG